MSVLNYIGKHLNCAIFKIFKMYNIFEITNVLQNGITDKCIIFVECR